MRLLVVGHGGVNRVLLLEALGLGLQGLGALEQDPACLNVLDFRDAVRCRLLLFNDTSHYAGHPRAVEAQLSKWWDAPG